MVLISGIANVSIALQLISIFDFRFGHLYQKFPIFTSLSFLANLGEEAMLKSTFVIVAGHCTVNLAEWWMVTKQ